jgi:protease-4
LAAAEDPLEEVAEVAANGLECLAEQPSAFLVDPRDQAIEVGLGLDRRLRIGDLVRLSGRVYTGRQAVKVKLIDEIGGEEQARSWLLAEKSVPLTLPVEDWEPRRDPGATGLGFASGWALRALGLEGFQETAERAQLDGLLVLWHPAQ